MMADTRDKSLYQLEMIRLESFFFLVLFLISNHRDSGLCCMSSTPALRLKTDGHSPNSVSRFHLLAGQAWKCC